MRKKFVSVLILVCLALTMAIPAAAVRTEESVERTIRAVGIMAGNASGDLMLGRSITRAEFITMMTNASPYKDTVGQEGSGYSLFKDVKSSHWASEYIRLGISKGWMVGYTDGTFRPEKTITLEEACTALLKLLGYTSESLGGSYPQAQLSKATAAGLREQLAAAQGTPMTRRDCMYLFYNLLTAKTNSGQYYAATLGYSVVNGEVDYTAATWDNVSGPYIAAADSPALPFTPYTVYRDGKAVSTATIAKNDVYYYNTGLGTLWIYTERVSGKITAVAPNLTAPTSVTVSGVTYSVGSSEAKWKLSGLGGKAEGSSVTLLLGMDGSVVDVLTGEQVRMTYYGVVYSAVKAVDTDDGAAVRVNLTVTCTDGVARTYTVDQSGDYSAGQLVSVQISGGTTQVKRLSERRTGGAVDRAVTSIGSQTLADSLEILDTNTLGGAVTLKRERLGGKTLTTSQVRYYTLDDEGKIDRLILADASGDLWNYGYLIAENDQSRGNTIATQYSIMLGGRTASFSVSGRYGVNVGGVAARQDATGALVALRNVSSTSLTQIDNEVAKSSSRTFPVADDVQVYIKQDNNFYAAKIGDLSTDKYNLTGYYDEFGAAFGGYIRMVIAREKIV